MLGIRPGHVYEWLRERRYQARDAVEATHFFLDGGKACVPDEGAPAFLNAYAASLLRCPHHRPCIVERRTPVFRMFLDLDTRFESREAISGFTPYLARMAAFMDSATREAPADAFAEASAAHAFGEAFGVMAPAPTPPDREDEGHVAIACAASRPVVEEGAFKSGFHVVWPTVLVTQATALELRRRVVDMAAAAFPDPKALGLVNGWDCIVDASVFRANGLRMPWSAKGRDDHRFYEPRWELHRGDATEIIVPTTLSSVRDMVHRLSIRTFGLHPTTCIEPVGGAPPIENDRPTTRAAGLAGYACVLPALAAALPIQFAGQRFTGLSVPDGSESASFFTLRSTARYCVNMGRPHRTNTVYFVLTRRGVSQRCFCRCETTEGRRFGMCKDFVGETWPVPDPVIRAFFGSATDSQPSDPTPLPSRAAKSFLDMDALASRSRPPPARHAKKPRHTPPQTQNKLNVPTCAA